jgi:hypothetical protein
VGDEVYWQQPDRERLRLFDAVTAYNMHRSQPDIFEDFAGKIATHYNLWSTAAAQQGTGFIPNVIPGFDDTAVRPEAQHPIIPRSQTLFTDQLESSLSLTNTPPHMIMITSWNEWHEYTSIEPSKEYGLGYLESLSTILDKRNSLNVED